MKARTESARPPGAVDILEEAMQVLTHLAPADWLRYLTGALPFLCGALAFGLAMKEPRYPETWAPLAALLMAILYIGLNVARAAFAGQIRRQLSGAAEPAWSTARLLGLVLVQTRLAAIRLWIYPLAILASFPWSWATTWLRTMTALNDTPRGGDWRRLRKTASEQAALWTAQGWRLLALFGFAWVVLFLNIVLTLALVPTLLKSLTGHESWLSRLGGTLVGSAPFLWIALGLTWLLLDPLIQAAYVVRSFHGESLATGEDLLARLRRFQRPAATVLLAAMLIALGAPVLADSGRAVSATEVNQEIRKTLATSEFEWMTRSGLHPAPETSIERLSRRILRPFERMTDWIGDQIQAFFDWLRDMMRMRPDVVNQPKVRPPGGLEVVLVVGAVLLLLAGVYLFLRNRRSRGENRRSVAASTGAVDLADENLDASRLPEQEWLDLSAKMEAEGDLRRALRALYLANLAWLGSAGFLVIDRAKTNGEYRREVARKARETPHRVQAFASNVRQFDAVWYGHHPVSTEDFTAFRGRTEQMKLAEVRS